MNITVKAVLGKAAERNLIKDKAKAKEHAPTTPFRYPLPATRYPPLTRTSAPALSPQPSTYPATASGYASTSGPGPATGAPCAIALNCSALTTACPL